MPPAGRGEGLGDMRSEGRDMNRMEATELRKDLSGYDLEITWDVQTQGNDDVEVFYVRTFQDRSVGIFGEQLSPEFRTYEDVAEWWKLVKSVFQA